MAGSDGGLFFIAEPQIVLWLVQNSRVFCRVWEFVSTNAARVQEPDLSLFFLCSYLVSCEVFHLFCQNLTPGTVRAVSRLHLKTDEPLFKFAIADILEFTMERMLESVKCSHLKGILLVLCVCLCGCLFLEGFKRGDLMTASFFLRR